MRLSSLFLLAASLAASAPLFAHDYQAGQIGIAHPYARPTVPGQPSGAAYLTLENKGKTADRLLSASSPAARRVEIHTMKMDGNVMKMSEVKDIKLDPAAKVTMQPGDGYHIMLIGLKQQLKTGDKIPLVLRFKKAGKVEVSAWVEDKPAAKDDAVKDDPAHKHH